MKFITIGAETIALCLAMPDWSRDVTVELTLPTDVARSLNARESRRNFAASFRYSLGYTALFGDARESTDANLWLLRLKGEETVAVPLWTDGVELAAAANAGATVLDKTSDMPVRFGAEWIVLNAEASTYEIVTVQSVTATLLSLTSGLTMNWPAGTFAYPLLFGQLTERPQGEELTDEITEAALKFEEDDVFARRLSTAAGALASVGAGIPEFSSARLWDIAPLHERPLSRTEVDIVSKQIGFGRRKQRRVRSQPVRRGTERTYAADGRAEIGRIERFFRDRRANVYNFLQPSGRGDLRITQDLPIAGNTSLVTVEATRFTDPAYLLHPSAPFFALVQRGDPPTVTPLRVNSVDIAGLHTAAPIVGTHRKEETILSHLLLVRFAETRLSLRYSSDGYAVCVLRTIEVPDEYNTPAEILAAPAYLYRFYVKLPNGSTLELGRFTSYENTISHGGHAWTPAPFSHGRITRTLTLSDATDLISWNFPGNPLRKFLPLELEGDLRCEIIEVNADNPGDADAEILFVGKVKEPRVKGDEIRARVVAFDFHSESKYPRMQVQKSDNFMPFTRPTGLNEADFKVTGTIAALDGFKVDVAGPAHAAEYFRGGRIERGAGETYEGRHIISSEPIAGGQRLNINRPFLQATVGQSVDLYPGYDGSYGDFLTRYGSGRFGGHPFVPDTGPQIKIEEAVQVSGGKK
jgi:hypothetical protein